MSAFKKKKPASRQPQTDCAHRAEIQATLACVWGEDVSPVEFTQTANPSIDVPSKPKAPETPRQVKTLTSAK